MGNLQGKIAYITGAGRGIGRALASKLSKSGASVVVNDLDEKLIEEVISMIEADGGSAVPVVGSITENDFASRFINAGLDAYGGVDIIINNAGYTWDSLIGNMTDQQFDAIIDVHLKAPFCILREASKFIIPTAKKEAAEGREVFRKVINISSVAGIGGNVGQVNYSSAKSGILGLTKALAKEWGRYKVNVNCVAFGLIETRLTEATDDKKTISVDGNEVAVGVPKKVITAFENSIPLRRRGTPEEAANGVYLFCIPESNYISGQTITVGGGFSM